MGFSGVFGAGAAIDSEWRARPRSDTRLHQSRLTHTISVILVQKISEVSHNIGPAASPGPISLFVGLCLIACASANVKSPAQARMAPTHDERGFSASERSHWDFFDVAGTRTPIVVTLPKAGNWQFDDQRSTWWVASNTELDLRLEAKLWSERRLVTPEECLADLHRWRDTAQETTESSPIESRVARLPEGFDSRLTVTLDKVGPDPTERAVVLLVGADISRCFGVVAKLEPQKPITQNELLARIALVTEGILPKIRLRTIEQRPKTERP